MEMGLDGKVAIVTGGSEGIGKAAAERMAGEGANVIIVARRQEVLDAAADEIRTATEGEVLPLSADVTDKGTAAHVVNTAIERYGRLDILVNNAGTSMAKGFEDVSDDDWELDFELKVWGAVRLIRASIPEMRKVGGGRIINVTNLGGRTPGANSMPTSISRAAGIAITKGLSKDLASDNILVNTVCIGLIKSGPASAPLRCPHRERAGLGHGRLLRPVGRWTRGAVGPRRRGFRGRRRDCIPGLRPCQLPDGRRHQHRRRGFRSRLVAIRAMPACLSRRGDHRDRIISRRIRSAEPTPAGSRTMHRPSPGPARHDPAGGRAPGSRVLPGHG